MKMLTFYRAMKTLGSPFIKSFDLSERVRATEFFNFIKDLGFEFFRQVDRVDVVDASYLEFVSYKLNNYTLVFYRFVDGYIVVLGNRNENRDNVFHLDHFISQLDDEYKDTILYHIDLFV